MAVGTRQQLGKPTADHRSRPVWATRSKHKAGIALLRNTTSGSEVLLVQQANGRWSLPKGKRKSGESVRQACLRECREETGFEAHGLRFVGWGVNSRKHVRFYLWQSQASELRWPESEQLEFPRAEIRAMAWFALEKALQILKPWQASLLARVS